MGKDAPHEARRPESHPPGPALVEGREKNVYKLVLQPPPLTLACRQAHMRGGGGDLKYNSKIKLKIHRVGVGGRLNGRA